MSSATRLWLVLCVVAFACNPNKPPPSQPGTQDPTPGLDTGTEDEITVDGGVDPTQTPILFVHGINGDETNFDVMRADFEDAGWAPELLWARTFDDPEWGCNVDNAATISAWVEFVKGETGAEKIHLVAHSMGTLSSRYYLKNLQGTDSIERYVTFGGMHHGLQSSCSPDFPFKPCIWDEICSTGDLVTQLNEAPATPGPTLYASIYGTSDETVPNNSSYLQGAWNIELPGLSHYGPDGVLEHPDALAAAREVFLTP